jgi:hypothetical protein
MKQISEADVWLVLLDFSPVGGMKCQGRFEYYLPDD